MRRFILLLFLAVLSCPIAAQPRIHLGPVTVSITSGQRTVVLRCDERGLVGLKDGTQWRLLGKLDSAGTLSTPEGNPALSLGEGGSVESGGEFTPLKIDGRAVVSTNDVEVFQVQTSTFREMLPAEQAIGRALSRVDIQGVPGTDLLAAYLIVTFLIFL